MRDSGRVILSTRAAVAYPARAGEGWRVTGTAAMTGRVSEASKRVIIESAKTFETGKDNRVEGNRMRGLGRGSKGIEEDMVVERRGVSEEHVIG